MKLRIKTPLFMKASFAYEIIIKLINKNITKKNYSFMKSRKKNYCEVASMFR